MYDYSISVEWKELAIENYIEDIEIANSACQIIGR